MAQLSSAIDDVASIPAFRSATDFPVKPKEERLVELYSDLLQALKSANVARRILRRDLDRKKKMIVEMRTAIERLESDLALEAETRLRLHAMNEQLIAALQEIEVLADDASAIVTDAHQTPRTGLGGLIEKLKSLVKRWRALKLRYSSGLVPPAGESGND